MSLFSCISFAKMRIPSPPRQLILRNCAHCRISGAAAATAVTGATGEEQKAARERGRRALARERGGGGVDSREAGGWGVTYAQRGFIGFYM